MKQEFDPALVAEARILFDQGYRRYKLAEALGLNEGQAKRLVTILKDETGNVVNPISQSTRKSSTLDSFRDLIKGTNFSIFDYAKAEMKSPQMVKTQVKKALGTFDPAGDSLKSMVFRGSTLRVLCARFGFKDLDTTLESIKKELPEALVFHKPLGDSDYNIVAIPNQTNSLDWLTPKKDKVFSFYVAPESNYLFVQFNGTGLKKIKIYIWTDVHIGHKNFDRERFISDIERVKEDPEAFVFITGDLIEWAHKLSVGDPNEQILSPNQQVVDAVKLLMPVAHKILGYRSGNHDRGRGKLTSTDLAEVMALMLQVPYFKVETAVDVDLEGQLFTIMVDHGHSGGSIQAILKDAEKYKEFTTYPVHFHISGHVHNSQIVERVIKTKEIGRGLSFMRNFTVVGGSYVKYVGSYAEEFKYSPAPQDLCFLQMHADGNYEPGRIRSNG